MNTRNKVLIGLAIVAVIGVWFFLSRTTAGYEQRMSGEATLFARYGFVQGMIRGWGEWLPMLLVVWMIFADKWWKVGAGYVAMSFIPIAWLSRTL